MDSFVAELSKPFWWVSVVVVGILINLASAYLKPWLDENVLGMFSWWRGLSAKRAAAWSSRIQMIMRSPENLQQAIGLEMRYRLLAINYLLFTITIFVITLVPTIEKSPALNLGGMYFGASIAAFLGFVAFLAGADTARALRTVEALRNKALP